MRKLLKKVAGIGMVVTLMFVPVVGNVGVTYAEEVIDTGSGWGGAAPDMGEIEQAEPEESGTNAPETSILPSDWDIEAILKFVLNLLVYGLGVAAVLGTIIAAIMYLTARDNEQQVVKAKTRLYEVVIGLVAWAVMFALLQWLIPGGLNLS